MDLVMKIESARHVSQHGKLAGNIMQTTGQKLRAACARLANVRAGVRAAWYQAAVELGGQERRRLVPLRVKTGISKPNAALPF